MENNKVLYISYTGMMEPLGSSQVLNYLYGLSSDYRFFLISLEKKEDYIDIQKKEQLKVKLQERNIEWHPLLYKSGAKGYLTNFYKTYRLAKTLYQKENISLVHCRSYMPASITYCIQRINKKLKYIFDTRGFWFDERADVGEWSRKGFLYKAAKKFERKLYLSSTHIVMLSHNGKHTILNNELFSGGDKLVNDITVIPTCVDLDRFNIKDREIPQEKITIGYVGTAIGWYNFSKTAELLAIIKEKIKYNLLILNAGQHEYITNELNKVDINREEYDLMKVNFEEMPKKIQEIDVSLFFIHPFFSKRASAATKLGELFASGIPVITNNGVGDHEYYINNYSIGKIVEVNELGDYNFEQILKELSSSECKMRCREVAEKYFSLSKGVDNYKIIYNKILGG